jgi:hypothetical protein
MRKKRFREGKKKERKEESGARLRNRSAPLALSVSNRILQDGQSDLIQYLPILVLAGTCCRTGVNLTFVGFPRFVFEISGQLCR